MKDLQFIESLIELVKDKPEIYNKDHPHANPKFRSKIWDEIAQQLNRTEIEVKTKWTSLRDQYTREHRKMKSTGIKSKWKHMGSLSFLEEYLQKKPNSSVKDYLTISETKYSISYVDCNENSSDTNSNNHYTTPPSPPIKIEKKETNLPSQSTISSTPKINIIKNERISTPTTSLQTSSDTNLGFLMNLNKRIRQANLPMKDVMDLELEVFAVVNKYILKHTEECNDFHT